MIAWLNRWWGGDARVSRASAADSQAFAALHAQSFRSGWSEEEFARLLLQREVISDRAVAGTRVVGFILSRLAAGEAEILSVAVDPAYRGQGLAKRLLDVHLRRLFEYGAGSVFLEVEEENRAALRLYAGRSFREVGRRTGYYANPGGKPADALVLRADLI